MSLLVKASHCSFSCARVGERAEIVRTTRAAKTRQRFHLSIDLRDPFFEPGARTRAPVVKSDMTANGRALEFKVFARSTVCSEGCSHFPCRREGEFSTRA